jgi:uncharacterized 2Fe-2S/4Fe-4S cluster protein (DUF4445 family)
MTTLHKVVFVPSGRSALVPDGRSILDAGRLASEPLHAECGGRGACGRCLVRILEGEVPEYRILNYDSGSPQALACLTPVHGPLTVQPLIESQIPRLAARERYSGLTVIEIWAPWPIDFDPMVRAERGDELGVALDVGTTTLRLLLIRLRDGVIVGEAGAYNPQIPKGADVISRIMASEKGSLGELSAAVRTTVSAMIAEAAAPGGFDPRRIVAYMVAGNPAMIHLLLAKDPSGIRRVPAQPVALAFPPGNIAEFGWPGDGLVYTVPAAGAWVGGDIMAGAVRGGLSRSQGMNLYVDLGTNGEVVLGRADFALACACSAGPAFEGGGIRCGMRADAGAIDGAFIDEASQMLKVSVIGGGQARGICGSGLIGLADALFRERWIDRSGKFTANAPERQRTQGKWGEALKLDEGERVTLWERDLASLIRAKAAVFAGIRSLADVLGPDVRDLEGILVSGNFGRFLNLPAAIGIGLLPAIPAGRYGYIDNGSLEGAALSLLSRQFYAEVEEYVRRVTYVDLSELPGYMDAFVAASFIPHTTPDYLHL